MNLMLTLVPLLFTTCLARDIVMQGTKVDLSPENLTPCETGWSDSGNYCYKFRGEKEEDALPWNEAVYDCEALGGKLASIHSYQENAFLTSTFIIKTKLFSWIGLQDQEEESNFVWQDGSLIDFVNWAKGEPSGERFGNEDCVGLNYAPLLGRLGDWNDGKCEENHSYICQKNRRVPEMTHSSEEGIDAKKIFANSGKWNPERSSTGKTTHSEVATFENISSLLNASENIPLGGLAFITDEQSLLIRVRKGWKYIQMRKLIPLLPPPTEISSNFAVSTDSAASKEYLENNSLISSNFAVSADSSARKEYLENNSLVAYVREENQQLMEKPVKEDSKDNITDQDTILEEKTVTKDTSESEIIEKMTYDLLNGSTPNSLKLQESETDLKENESSLEIDEISLKISEILKETESHLGSGEKWREIYPWRPIYN